MKILVCGASGFIGRSISQHLVRAGHEVVRGVRQTSLPGDIRIDFTHDGEIQQWFERLAGIDVVVNAVGIIVEHEGAHFEKIHHKVPVALFSACVMAGVKRVIQISAWGAEYGETPYFKSKYAADQWLMSLPIAWQILRPAFVYGTEGKSASMFRALASLPVIPIPELGQTLFQPIHIDDLTRAVERAIDLTIPARQQVDLVGGLPVTFRAMLAHYRRGMGFENALFLTIPAVLMHVMAKLSAMIPGALLTPANWSMLQAGCAGRTTSVTRLLGYPPKGIDLFIEGNSAELLRLQALSAWRPLLLRYTLGMVWLVTAYVSTFVYPATESLALLQRTGLAGALASGTLYTASILDFAMGIACFIYPRRALWVIQTLLVVIYSAIITIALPEFLSHPFGPIIKNLPILAILFILCAESKTWTI